jgi:hypothetical protein
VDLHKRRGHVRNFINDHTDAFMLQTYKAVTKMDLDTLWQVEDEFLRVPQWSTTVSPAKRNTKAAGVSAEPKRRSGGHETLRIPDGNDSDPTSIPASMPELEAATDPGSDASADSSAAIKGRTDESDAGSSDSDDEESSAYDSEEEAELRDLLREAMDIASAHPEIFEEKKAFEERSNDNQFLKALGALRGKWRRLPV